MPIDPDPPLGGAADPAPETAALPLRPKYIPRKNVVGTTSDPEQVLERARAGERVNTKDRRLAIHYLRFVVQDGSGNVALSRLFGVNWSTITNDIKEIEKRIIAGTNWRHLGELHKRLTVDSLASIVSRYERLLREMESYEARIRRGEELPEGLTPRHSQRYIETLAQLRATRKTLADTLRENGAIAGSLDDPETMAGLLERFFAQLSGRAQPEKANPRDEAEPAAE